MFSPKIIDSHTEPKEYRLGVLLYKGTRVDRDIKEAMEQFRLAWAGGHKPSGYNYAVLLYENGQLKSAITIFSELVDDFPDAYYFVSQERGNLSRGSDCGSKLCSLAFGLKLLEEDKVEGARDKFEVAVESTDEEIKTKACEGLGIIKMKEKDYIGALNELIYASEKGLTESQYWLGKLYLTQYNIIGACNELKKASDKGHELATVELGKINLSQGEVEKGLRLLKSVDNDESRSALVEYYVSKNKFAEALANCTEEDKENILEQAYEYAMKFTDHEQSFQLLTILWNIYEMRKACLGLGECYVEGIGCDPDLGLSYDYYRRSNTFEGWLEVAACSELGYTPCEVDFSQALYILDEKATKVAKTEEEFARIKSTRERIERKIRIVSVKHTSPKLRMESLPNYDDLVSESDSYVEVSPNGKEENESELHVEVSPDGFTRSKAEIILKGKENDPKYLYIAGCIYMAEGDNKKAKETFKKGAREGDRDCLVKLGELTLEE